LFYSFSSSCGEPVATLRWTRVWASLLPFQVHTHSSSQSLSPSDRYRNSRPVNLLAARYQTAYQKAFSAAAWTQLATWQSHREARNSIAIRPQYARFRFELYLLCLPVSLTHNGTACICCQGLHWRAEARYLTICPSEVVGVKMHIALFGTFADSKQADYSLNGGMRSLKLRLS
jgi:hypothetical protein